MNKYPLIEHHFLIQIPVLLTTIPDSEVETENYSRDALNLVCKNTAAVENITKIESISQFNRDRGQKTLHPLATVLDNSLSTPVKEGRYSSDLYIVFLKDVKCGEFKYGRKHYDYEEGTLLCIAPGQVFGFESEQTMVQPTGWTLAFHPDLIHGTNLGRHIGDYRFFSYDSNEALHVSETERNIVLQCFEKIRYELTRDVDKHSRTLIVSNIELFLNYCVRFYDRQFVTREVVHKDVLSRFESLLKEYFDSDKPQTLGLPTVAYCSGQLNFSPNYFGDLIKRESGKTAQEYIQLRLMDIAKEKVLDVTKTVSEVAYALGFKYPSHFTRMFKQHVGHSPSEYRTSLN